jgi:hypothetical protein
VIDSFEVSNFKLFEHLKLEELGRVNLIVGANNTGKTALLEALYLDGRRDFAAAVIDIMRQRKQSGEPKVEQFLKSWFGSGEWTAQLGASKLEIHRRHDREVFQRSFGELGPFSFDTDRNLTELNKDRLPFRMDFEDCLAIWQGGLDEEIRDFYWDHFVLRGDDERMFDLLRVLHPKLHRVGLVSDGLKFRQAYYRNGDGNQYPLARLGEGMNRLLGIAFGMTFARGQRLLVDEIETGLHHKAMKQVWRWVFESAAAMDVQVFATTHSFDCVKAFARTALDSPELGRLYRLDTLLGPLRVVAYTERQMGIAAEQGIEVR